MLMPASATSRPAWGWLAVVLASPIVLVLSIEASAVPGWLRAGFEFGAAVLAIATLVAWFRTNGGALAARESRQAPGASPIAVERASTGRAPSARAGRRTSSA
jgi:hypothetical protein